MPHLCCAEVTLNDKSLVRLDADAIDRILRRVASDKFDPKKDLDPELFEHTFGALNKAIDKGFGAVEYGDADFAFINELKYNSAVFSAFKTHRQQNDLRDQLFDSDGQVRSFAQFRTATEPIIGSYNTTWLQTEYSTAIIRAQHAVKWREMERTQDLYPNLEWMPSTSADPREAHRAFYGIVRAMNDAFWASHYPGNLWGCKCGVRSTDAPVSDRSDMKSALKEAPKPAKGLDENPGRSGAIFSKSHPYFTEVNYKAMRPVAERYANERMVRQTLEQVRALKEAIDKYRGLEVFASNLHTGSAIFLRRTFKDIRTHNPDYRVLQHILNPAQAVKEWKYIGQKSVENYPKGHKKTGQRKHPDAEYFTYYEVEIAGKLRYVNMKFSGKFQREVPYAITDNLESGGLKKRKP